MKRSKQFTSLSVISLEEGQQIGMVKGLVVDPVKKKIAALIIEQKGWFKEQRFIPYHKVHSVGNDAITIEKNTCVEKIGNLSEILKLLKDKIGLIDSKIVAENGTVLGYVDEFYVDLDTGVITGLEFSGNRFSSMLKGRAFIDISYVRTFGKEVTIVTDEGTQSILKLEGGLQETVKNIRESTGQFWGSTIKKTKELSNNINKKVKKESPSEVEPDDDGSTHKAAANPPAEEERDNRPKDTPPPAQPI